MGYIIFSLKHTKIVTIKYMTQLFVKSIFSGFSIYINCIKIFEHSWIVEQNWFHHINVQEDVAVDLSKLIKYCYITNE